MLGLNVTVRNEDVVNVMGDLYVKDRLALARLLFQLKRAGYQIDNLRRAEYRKRDGTSVRNMEKNGWSLWFAKLPNIRFGLCGSCNKLISVRGIQSHGHKCEKCGAVTYYKLVDGSTLRFVFNNDEERGPFSPQLNMKVKRWDTENGFLYLYYNFLDGGLSTVTGEKALSYLDRNKDKWGIVKEDGVDLLKIKYTLDWNRETAVIEPYDTWGSESNHNIVKVWKAKQYDEWDRLPVPETISIFESWHWAPLPVSPTLHSRILHAAHQTDDQGYFYQDGRSYFTSGHWTEMAKFVRHFTQLNADDFDKAWPSFRRDGPGGVADLARFCCANAKVRNDPNIGNVLVALGKGMGGHRLTDQEVEAAKHGLGDPATKEFLRGLRGR